MASYEEGRQFGIRKVLFAVSKAGLSGCNAITAEDHSVFVKTVLVGHCLKI